MLQIANVTVKDIINTAIKILAKLNKCVNSSHYCETACAESEFTIRSRAQLIKLGSRQM